MVCGREAPFDYVVIQYYPNGQARPHTNKQCIPMHANRSRTARSCYKQDIHCPAITCMAAIAHLTDPLNLLRITSLPSPLAVCRRASGRTTTTSPRPLSRSWACLWGPRACSPSPTTAPGAHPPPSSVRLFSASLCLILASAVHLLLVSIIESKGV